MRRILQLKAIVHEKLSLPHWNNFTPYVHHKYREVNPYIRQKTPPWDFYIYKFLGSHIKEAVLGEKLEPSFHIFDHVLMTSLPHGR